ncbi:hypothetical protein BD410DRAFT_794253 [Rickenella mellea]|uniref:Uncharacterized protein n=1 Tax=Rickenella mellea TaxID=50990 RepID=A0A4Y7PRB2_9AGAM|nr:hypothetical protein BD410DRAFT_794253 [Rickenella mellea]
MTSPPAKPPSPCLISPLTPLPSPLSLLQYCPAVRTGLTNVINADRVVVTPKTDVRRMMTSKIQPENAAVMRMSVKPELVRVAGAHNLSEKSVDCTEDNRSGGERDDATVVVADKRTRYKQM